MTAYTFRLSLDCPHCRGGVPVNGFTTEVLCSSCLKPVPLEQEWWESVLDNETLEEALACEPGHGTSSSHLGGLSERVEAGNRAPRCQGCKTDFTQAQLAGAVAGGGFECPGCKQRIRVRRATPLAKAIIHDADLLVHEDEMGSELHEERTAPEPMVMACISCGGSLQVDGSSRTPKCAHCGNANYLPDALWLRLHPAPVSHAFFVTRLAVVEPSVLTPETLPKQLSPERAQKLLKDQSLSSAVLDAIMERVEEDDDVLEALAKHPNASEALLAKLCDDDLYYKIRVNVAKRPKLSPQIADLLSRDSDSDVREAMLRRSDLFDFPQAVMEEVIRGADSEELGQAIEHPKFPEWRLYELSDYTTPDHARRILKSPNVSIRVLKRLGINEENREFVKAHPLYQGMGWLRKLFFFG